MLDQRWLIEAEGFVNVKDEKLLINVFVFVSLSVLTHFCRDRIVAPFSDSKKIVGKPKGDKTGEHHNRLHKVNLEK